MDKTRAGSSTTVLLAAGTGALLMYLLDPQQGRRRTALARDKLVHLARMGSDVAEAGGRDLANRATGVLAELRHVVRSGSASDEVLVGRVRARLGRCVSHPHAVQVSAAAGCVTLSGPVLRSEEAGLLRSLRTVRGVRAVENRLEVHERAGNLPALQGGNGRAGPRAEFMQAHWAPGPRLLTVAAGTALAGYGFGRHDPGGTLLGIAGVALALRAAANQTLDRALGLSQDRRAVEIQKTVTIAAPREIVFEHWSNFDNFPRFMSHVEEVRRLDDTRSHWVVKGPAGTRVEWDAVITEHVRPQRLAWSSEPGAPVQHAGSVQFDEQEGGTRVTVRMRYNPPGGAAGHAVARLLGRDPKQEMDADLMRMKAFIETGIAPHDAAWRDRGRSAAASPRQE
jgi:uncharacterized membrane protein